jgi:hypothetical protein
MFKRITSFSNLTLLVALSLSTVAAYYSIIGLTAIFAGAVIPIIIMGSILEVGKITTTVWLRKYWHRASLTLKFYLVPAVILLAFLTSMGIFGFLSKAHSDQSLVSGDVLAKLEIVDEKIKTSKENIDANRKALKQLDEAVDQVMGRSTSEAGADKAVAIRKAQARDRARLLAEISQEQKTIAKLNEEAAPIRAEVRKVEAEVGPIKYIAAFIYGDNPDSNLLEAAVRWVIILIVIVFDPLAIALVLAANASKEWDKEEVVEETKVEQLPTISEQPEEPKYEPDEGPLTNDQVEQLRQSVVDDLPEVDPPKDPAPIGWMFGTPSFTPKKVKKTKKKVKNVEEPTVAENVVAETVSPERPGDYIETDVPVVIKSGDGYVTYNGKHMSEQVLRGMEPALFKESAKQISNGYGTSFPAVAEAGDMFVRIDVMPNKVFKFNSRKWIEINKETTSSYLDNNEYLKFLVSKISSGEYDIDMLTDSEQDAIKAYMNGA